MNEQRGDAPRAGADQRSGREQTAAQLAFYREVIPELSQLALHTGLSSVEAEDAVQTVLLKFLEQPQIISPEKAPVEGRAWLLAVARHEIANAFRERQRHLLASLDALPAEPRDNREDEAATAARERLLEKLQSLLTELRENEPVNHRLLVGHHVDGRSIQELADAEALTVAAVWSRLQRVRAALRKRLSDFLDAEG